MSRYDDERVITLLRESVPAPPDAPDRLDAVRRRAGQQRVTAWTQTLGVAASVLLVLGLVAVATGGRGGSHLVAPTAKPLEALAAAFAEQTSVRFEASMKPVGAIDPAGTMAPREQLERILTSHVTGAATKDGDLQIDGDLSFLTSWTTRDGELSEQDTHWRFVGGKSYRSTAPGDNAPPGKEWLLEEGDSDTSAADLDKALTMLRAVAEDVRYVRGATVRGTPVAEYRLTVPERWANQRLDVTFALDAEHRLRRVATEFSWLTVLTGGEPPEPGGPSDPMRVRVELVLFGYGDDIEVKAPPTSEVISQEALYEERQRELDRCLAAAGDRPEHEVACHRQHLPGGTFERPAEPLDDACIHMPGPDGSTITRCSGSSGTIGDVSASTPPSARPSPAATRSPAP